MIRIFIITLIFISSTSFGYRQSKHCKLATKISREYVKEVARPLGLILEGEGGAMMGDIQSFSLSFAATGAYDIKEARKIYVHLMESFLEKINSNCPIRQYLHEYPFGPDNYKLTLSFVDQNRQSISDGHVALMFIAKNKLLFAAFDPEKSLGNQFYTIHEEPYSEARRIVLEQSSSCSEMDGPSDVNTSLNEKAS